MKEANVKTNLIRTSSAPLFCLVTFECVLADTSKGLEWVLNTVFSHRNYKNMYKLLSLAIQGLIYLAGFYFVVFSIDAVFIEVVLFK